MDYDHTEYYDVRQEVEHDLVEGQVYVDARYDDIDHEEELTLIYIDEQIAVLRSSEDLNRQSGKRHRQMPRAAFEEQVGSGRLRKIRDAEEFDPNVKLSEVLARAKRLRDYWNNSGGRKNTHKADGIQAFIEELKEMRQRNGEEVPFEEISRVGEKTAKNLRNGGFVTERDIEAASDDDLLAVDGVGETNLVNIREYIR